MKQVAVNGAISKTSFTDQSSLADSVTSVKAKTVHINELRTAVDTLTSASANVDNCGNCTFCQGNQSNQNCQTDGCEGCQTSYNQSCETCQTCQNATLNQSNQANQSNQGYNYNSCQSNRR